jgi:hypothetical protein
MAHAQRCSSSRGKFDGATLQQHYDRRKALRADCYTILRTTQSIARICITEVTSGAALQNGPLILIPHESIKNLNGQLLLIRMLIWLIVTGAPRTIA